MSDNAMPITRDTSKTVIWAGWVLTGLAKRVPDLRRQHKTVGA